MQIINKSSLANFYYRVKLYPDIPKDVFVFLVVVLVAFGAFSIGRYSVLDAKRGGELKILDSSMLASPGSFRSVAPQDSGAKRDSISMNPVASVTAALPANPGMYVGAKSGKTYYFPWCGGVKRIKEANKVWFSTKEEAEIAGYKPSTNCPGI